MSDGTVEREGYGKALFDPGQFRDKVVMVTGAGKGSGPGGIGYNAAMAFARARARLAIIGRTPERIGRTIADAEPLGAETVSGVGVASEEGPSEKLCPPP